MMMIEFIYVGILLISAFIVYQLIKPSIDRYYREKADSEKRNREKNNVIMTSRRSKYQREKAILERQERRKERKREKNKFEGWIDQRDNYDDGSDIQENESDLVAEKENSIWFMDYLYSSKNDSKDTLARKIIMNLAVASCVAVMYAIIKARKK